MCKLKKVLLCLEMLIVISVLSGCTFLGYYKDDEPAYSADIEKKHKVVNLSDEDAMRLAEERIKKMTTEEKVGQLFVVNLEQLDNRKGDYYEFKKSNKTMKQTIKDIPVGGIILFSRNISNRKKTSRLISNLQGVAKDKMFVMVDEEGGDVSRIASNKKMKTTSFPSAEEIGRTKDADYVYNMGATIAGQIRELGFNVDLAPVGDVKTTDINTEIGNRSFGSDAQKVAEMVSAFVQGCQTEGVSATVKHFPGQGSSEGDTHRESVDIDNSISAMRQTDFVPFSSGIKAGTDFIMVSHISVSRVTETDEPASMSELVMTTILRDELGFGGIIITDAFDMTSITDEYTAAEAAVGAVRSGADIVLMPQNLRSAYDGVLSAVKSEEIPEDVINDKVLRILKIKYKRGILS